MFQSSPTRQGRCFVTLSATRDGVYLWFQSSPTRQGRCFDHASGCCPENYSVSILTDPSGPVLRPDISLDHPSQIGFQSSPTRQGRCF